MLIASLIERKRDGEPLSPSEWTQLIGGYTAGDVPDYQVSALLMAVLWRGMDSTELDALAEALLRSGDTLTFPGLGQTGHRQAFHRRGRRQDLAHPRTTGRRLRRRGPDDGRARVGSYRRDDRQAGMDSRLPHGNQPSRSRTAASDPRVCDPASNGRDRPRRWKAVCPARCDRHSGIDSPDRGQHHVQEAGRGARRPRPRCQSGKRRRCFPSSTAPSTWRRS